MIGDPREIVAVEVDVGHAHRRRRAFDRGQAIGEPPRERHAARLDADEPDPLQALVPLENFVGDAGEGAIDRSGVEDADARGETHRSTLLSASPGRIQGRRAGSGRMLAWRARWFRISAHRFCATSIWDAGTGCSSSKLKTSPPR